ncbi:hypothetical protein ACFQGX_38730 [Nonomuraea dietziae]|uniref:hypothetical protein n=1 Tax=Nonomuraea dietziae TaxID=65515 RepID=UPI0036079750
MQRPLLAVAEDQLGERLLGLLTVQVVAQVLEVVSGAGQPVDPPGGAAGGVGERPSERPSEHLGGGDQAGGRGQVTVLDEAVDGRHQLQPRGFLAQPYGPQPRLRRGGQRRDRPDRGLQPGALLTQHAAHLSGQLGAQARAHPERLLAASSGAQHPPPFDQAEALQPFEQLGQWLTGEGDGPGQVLRPLGQQREPGQQARFEAGQAAFEELGAAPFQLLLQRAHPNRSR